MRADEAGGRDGRSGRPGRGGSVGASPRTFAPTVSEPPDGRVRHGGPGAAGIVAVRDVRKRFGSVPALTGATLTVQRATTYALLGRNGAGKSTLVNILATLLPPDSGSVEVDGRDVVRDAGAVRRRIGLAGQFAAVDGFLTGRENVEMIGRLYGLGRREARRRTEEVLGFLGLGDVADRRVSGYSGGVRRRLDLAGSLVGRPAVMLLDEPTTGLDPEARLQIWEILRGLVAAGTSVLLTTQYLDEADALADTVGIIDRGRIVAEGTPVELKDSLGASLIRLRVRAPDVTRARDLTADLAGSVGVGGVIRLPAIDGSRTLLEVLHRLEADRLEPLELSLERPSLDEVFLTLTREHATGGGTS